MVTYSGGNAVLIMSEKVRHYWFGALDVVAPDFSFFLSLVCEMCCAGE